MTPIDVYVLSIVNCVFIVCLCTTFQVVTAFCQLPNKRICYVIQLIVKNIRHTSRYIGT